MKSGLSRRNLLRSATVAPFFWYTKGAFAQQLTVTPTLTIGPYYPDRLPLDLDNDLLLINDSITPAVGDIMWVTGRVLDSSGTAVRGAVVEIWQADNNGAYIHTASPIANRDTSFQGYGKVRNRFRWPLRLPHRQARPLSRKDASYSLPNQSARSRQSDYPVPF